MNNNSLVGIWYRYWPGHLLGELLKKRWTETAIPVVVLVAVASVLSTLIPNYFAANQVATMARQMGEIGFVVLGLSLVLISGGIDLSVGSTFALANFTVLVLLNAFGWPLWAAIIATLVVGGLLGAVNGLLVGYLRLRAFLTTLITLIVYRALYELLIERYSTQIAGGTTESATWDLVGSGLAAGLPFATIVFLVVAAFGHVFLTRLRPGWNVFAVGGSRRSAYNAGIPVRRTILLCYVGSALLTTIGSIFFASRLSTVGGDIGVGLEVTALTAAVVGGISLGGGRGSVTKAVVGVITVLMITNGLTSLSAPGGVNRVCLALILLAAATIDIRWLKNRERIINSVYASPTYRRLAKSPSCLADSGTVFAVNDALKDVELIGLGEVEGPEDVAFDQNGHLYCGTRHGEIIRFFAPDYKTRETFAHVGGHTLGLSFDREGNLFVCVGGMGLYLVRPSGVVEKATDETNRSWSSVNDDSRLRLADDLDIAPDGRVFFSEATTRYEMDQWPVDGIEGRGNGRIICYDPGHKTTRTVLNHLQFPNGICVASDHQSILFAETFACKVSRYWFDGPKKGRVEVVLSNLPGYPDNINVASDGTYWLALMGMRSPTFDLAMRFPKFRKSMITNLPADEWLFPNINTGCVIKFDEEGRVLTSLWDLGGKNHPMITSMREHHGYLYLGGISNNRIGRYKLPDADTSFSPWHFYWAGR